MSVTTPDIRAYIRDTKQNILNRDANTDGQWAFATDTGALLVSVQGGWIEYKPGDVSGSSQVTHDQTVVDVNSVPLLHVDATDISSITQTTGGEPSDGDNIHKWQSQNKRGVFNMEQPDPVYMPQYHANGLGNNKPGVLFNNTYMVNDSEQARMNQLTGDFTVLQVVKFLPVLANDDLYGLGYDIDSDGPGDGDQDGTGDGTNYVLPEARTSFDLYGGYNFGSSYSDQIESGLYLYENANRFYYWYYYRGMSVNTGTSMTRTDVFERQSSPYLDKINMKWGDVMILGHRYSSGEVGHRSGRVETTVAGNTYRNIQTTNNTTWTLNGFQIGNGSVTTSYYGQHYLGEMLVYNDCLDTNTYNQLGELLSQKWNTTWGTIE